MKGFVDTHCHAPQYAFVGTGRIPLLEWLQKYTFPTESKFSDLEFARNVYKKTNYESHGVLATIWHIIIDILNALLLLNISYEAGQR